VSRARFLIAPALAALMVALAGTALSAPSAETAGRSGPRILFASCGGAFTVRADGSDLTPVVPRARHITPLALSRDGRTVAYVNENSSGNISVSRANGAALRPLVHFWGGPLALSRNGRLLALPGRKGGVWIVRTTGGGLRRVTSARYDAPLDWSSDGNALLVSRDTRRSSNIILQPLHGRSFMVARGGGEAGWSPDGRWIAYTNKGLWLVRPDGGQRHRVAAGVSYFAWAPDGKRLAIAGHSPRHGYRLGFARVDGRGAKWLRLSVVPGLAAPSWSPDGRLIVFPASPRSGSDESGQLWVIRGDGSGLRRLTGGCGGEVEGWTRMVPVLPPDPPQERVLGPTTIATRDPVQELSADGSQVAFEVQSSPNTCEHIDVWTPGSNTIPRLDCGGGYGLAFAGTRAAWTTIEGCGNSCDVSLSTATVASPTPVKICDVCGNFSVDEGPRWDFHLHGDGDLLVFDDAAGETPRLVRVGGGTEHCQEGEPGSPAICTTLRRGDHAAPVDSVSGGLIAVRETDEVAILDAQGALVREFPFLPDEVTAARLDAGHLVVGRTSFIDVYDVATGARIGSQTRPAGFTLSDVDGGVALLRHGETIMLLRLDDGRSRTFAPGHGPRLADLEPSGLYYSYAAGVEGRVVFVPRAELF
jgi:Tol biopolymer transport system component